MINRWCFQVREMGLASLKFLCSVVFFALLLAYSTASSAQSVRPPDNAVNTVGNENYGPANTLGQNSQSDYWRAIRRGEDGILMQSRGEEWRLLRTDYILKYSGWTLLAVLGVIALFFVIRGRIRIKSGRSGKVVPRFTLSERVVHWFTASNFILLAISGLILLLGKPLLIPLIGKDANGLIASAALQGHNLFGPLFAVALVLLFFTFVRGNMLQLVDFKWMLKGGGFLGGHVSSHRYNFGEKTWFWLVTLVGLLLAVTGIAMLVPWAMPELVYLQGATVLHGIGGVALIAFAIGHVYIGTIGMEGALEGMTRGTVDENWAREHHDLWHEEHLAASTEDATAAEAQAAHGKV